MKYFGLSFLLLFSLNVNVCAQDTLLVEPEGNMLSGDIIEPYTNRWKVFVTDGKSDKKLVRIWTDYTQILEIDGMRRVHRVQDLYSANYDLEQTWINVVDAETLSPLRYSIRGAGGSLSTLRFETDYLFYGTNQNNSDTFKMDSVLIENPVYDWNLYGLLLAGLPFERKLIYKIPVWLSRQRAPGFVHVRMAGSEDVETLLGDSIRTQKMVTDKNLTFWVTKEKPFVIQLTLDMPNGSTMIWQMY